VGGGGEFGGVAQKTHPQPPNAHHSQNARTQHHRIWQKLKKGDKGFMKSKNAQPPTHAGDGEGEAPKY